MYARTLLEYVCKNDSKGYGWANADPDAEVVSLSPKTLLESDPYVCEICNRQERETSEIRGRCRTCRCIGGGTRCHGFVEVAEEGDIGVRDSAWWRLAGVEGLGGVRRGGVVVGIEQTRCSGNRRGGGLAVPSVVVAAEE
nr:protein SHOOT GRAVITROPISM 5-like [Ipomoea batatas]